MSEDRSGAYVLVGLAGLLLLAGLILHAWLSWPLSLEEPAVVTIDEGMTGRQIGERLREEGILRFTLPFRVTLWLMNADNTLRHGTMRLTPPVSRLELIQTLQSRRPLLKRVRILEGWPSWRIFEELSRRLDLPKETFQELFDDEEFLRAHDVPADSLEGYLFPETYYVSASADHRAVLRQMVERFHEVARELDLERRAEQHGFSLDEAVRIASLIEREAKLDDERPLVSAVFHNRLERGWPLQADPTLLYGAGDFGRGIGYSLLRRDGPYNTYTRGGLPPGAICSPGRASLEASVAPADTDYLFFVAKGDGSHVFSRTHRNHNRAVERYQK